MLYLYLSILICMMLRVSVIFFFFRKMSLLRSTARFSRQVPQLRTAVLTQQRHASKAVDFGKKARQEMLVGLDTLARAVTATLGPKVCHGPLVDFLLITSTPTNYAFKGEMGAQLCVYIHTGNGCTAVSHYSFVLAHCHRSLSGRKATVSKILKYCQQRKGMIASTIVNSSRNKPIMVHVKCCSMQLE